MLSLSYLIAAGSKSLTDLLISCKYITLFSVCVCIFFKNSHTQVLFIPVNIEHGLSLPKPCLNKVSQRNPPNLSRVLSLPLNYLQW